MLTIDMHRVVLVEHILLVVTYVKRLNPLVLQSLELLDLVIVLILLAGAFFTDCLELLQHFSEEILLLKVFLGDLQPELLHFLYESWRTVVVLDLKDVHYVILETDPDEQVWTRQVLNVVLVLLPVMLLLEMVLEFENLIVVLLLLVEAYSLAASEESIQCMDLEIFVIVFYGHLLVLIVVLH